MSPEIIFYVFFCLTVLKRLVPFVRQYVRSLHTAACGSSSIKISESHNGVSIKWLLIQCGICVCVFTWTLLTTSEKLNRYKSEKKDSISFLKDSFPGNFPTINIIPIIEAEIKDIISSGKPKNSSGYEEITSKIIRSCASLISSPLNYIYNYSLHTGIFPDHLKMAVKPLYKKGDKFDILN